MRKHLNLIQFSRALIPLFVILLHTKAFMATYFHYDFLHLSNVERSGGVYYFFALSGFMVYYVFNKDFGNKRKMRQYLYGRFIRIYPIYWILTLCVLPIYFIFPSLGSGNERELSHIIASILLFPDGDYPILSVAWSLTHTVFYYLVISLAFFKNKWVSIIIPFAWGIISFAFSIHLFNSSNFFVNFLFNFNNLIFLSGICCAFTVTRVKINFSLSSLLVLVGMLGFPLSWINEQFGFIGVDLQLLTTLSSIFLLLGFASIDIQREVEIPRLAKLLGDASFSIYLTHFTWMSALSILLSSSPITAIPNFLVALLLIVSSLIVGCLVYLLLERPLNGKLKEFYRQRQAYSIRNEEAVPTNLNSLNKDAY
jgi:peptidoglycan/LPS O-acetylase OafA/YrhL